jgi:hypothetical protein
MYSETPAQLVKHLEHPHGWWRDTAQKLLVLRQDKSVVAALRAMAQKSPNQLARIHALWTLEGLESLDAAFARQLMKDRDPQIRIQATRASESLYKGVKGDKSFANDYRALAKDSDPNVVIQALLTMNLLRVDQHTAVIESTMAASASRGIKEIGAQLLKPMGSRGQAAAFADPELVGSLPTSKSAPRATDPTARERRSAAPPTARRSRRRSPDPHASPAIPTTSSRCCCTG